MKNLVLHIRYLLTQHDCVIVPGWGALVVQHECASFDLDNNIVTPPRRWISFNPLLAHSDGVLAHSIMRERACTYEQAMAVIDEQVVEWRECVLRDGKVMWDKIGTFTKQDDTTMIFAEADDVEVLASISLLQSLSMPLLSQLLVPVDDDKELIADEDTVSTPSRVHIGWKRRAWQAVASVAIIVMVMLSISTPVDSFETTNDYAALVAVEMLNYKTIDETPCLVNDTISSVVVNEAVDEDVDNTIDILTESVDSDYVATNDAATVESTSTITEVQVSEEHPRYILVIGSLTSLSQAQVQIVNFRHAGVEQDIKIYENAGKYRLYIDGYSTMSQAQQRLDSLTAMPENPFSGIWICSTRQ